MKEYRVTISGNPIAVYESPGRGHPVLLVHGNSASGLTFSNVLQGSLGGTHRVVAFDLPGHGKSEPPRNPEASYSLPGYARIVTGLAQKLDLGNAVLIGWSLGGHVIMEAASSLPEAAGFIIYGAPPLGKPPAMEQAFGVVPGMEAMFASDADAELVRSLIDGYFSHASRVATDDLAAMWRQTDGAARALLGQSFAAGRYADEVHIVRDLQQPIAILRGEHEKQVRLEYLESLDIPSLWRGAPQTVPDAGHAIHLENPDLFSRLVAEFISETAA